MFRAKLAAIGAAVGLFLLGFIKVLVLQRDAAREDARRAKKHLDEGKKIKRAEQAIKRDMREAKEKAVKDIKDGKVPDNIRDRNNF